MKATLVLVLLAVPFISKAQWSAPDANQRIFHQGPVGINVLDTKGYQLAIGGKVVCEEVVVKLRQNWPDYVFKPGYPLPDLSELEAYVAQNGHLPGVPSAREIEENGVHVVSISVVMLQKIEELTLYLIAERNRLRELETRLCRLEEQNK